MCTDFPNNNMTFKETSIDEHPKSKPMSETLTASGKRDLMNIRVSENFFLWEFVPRNILYRLEERALLLIDSRIIEVAQYLRKMYGKTFINTYGIKGHLQNSGFRPCDAGIGAEFSQHKYGRAVDLKFPETSHAIIFKQITTGESIQKDLYQLGARRLEDIEDTPTWIHIDLGEGKDVIENKLKVFNP